MVIYIDIYFFINLIIDFIILSVPVSGLKANIVRRILGAFMGAIYACLYFFDVPKTLFSPVTKLVVLFLMTATVFSPCRIKTFLKSFVFIFFTSVFICGTIYAVMSFFYTSVPLMGVKINDLIVVTGALVGYLVFMVFIKVFKKDTLVPAHKIEIFYKGKSVRTHGITDTGNSLKDPLNGYPVIVTNERILKKLLNAGVCSANLCEFVNPSDFRVIPFKTVSSSGIMNGFIPEKVIIDTNTYQNVIIAAAPNAIKTDALINPMLVSL